MLSSKNRLYGLAIGGAIGDAMGSLAQYAPDLTITSPYSAQQVDIKPGYWTEPTSIWLSELGNKHLACTEVSYADLNPTLTSLIKTSVYCVRYHDDFQKQLHTVSSDHSIIERDLVKLWTAIMDGVLHVASKKSVFKMEYYMGLDLVPEVLLILQEKPDLDPDSIALITVNDVLTTFRHTDNFISGLKVIVNGGTACPSWAAALYGQLAGAYYGITDIPESWMDVVQKADVISDLLDPLCESITDIRLQTVTTDPTIST